MAQMSLVPGASKVPSSHFKNMGDDEVYDDDDNHEDNENDNHNDNEDENHNDKNNI